MLEKIIALIMLFLSLGQTGITEYRAATNPGGELFLVNRTYMLTKDYVPDDLVKPNVLHAGENILLRKDAAEALESMFLAAQEEAGLQLSALSGYRSYGSQAAIHERKVKAVGKKAALRVSAPAGASEHQLGLAMDLCTALDSSLTERFAQTPEGQWVRENCARFGFIIRYEAEWEEITGYSYEPWHVRYVGREHAEIITQAHVPLEVYALALNDERLNMICGN